MSSTYSNLKIELMGTGDQSGTWGTTTNTNLGTAIEEAITGSADVAFSSADITLTLTNTNTAQTARNLRLNLTGTSGGARNLTVPDIEKFYIIANGLANDVTVKNSTGTTYTVPAGTTGQVFSTGTGIKAGQSFFEGAILSSAAVILGGTINATPVGNISASTGAFTTLSATGAITYGGVTLSNAVTGTGNMVLSASPTLTGTPAAPTAAPGTNTTQIATTAFVQNVAGGLGTMSTQNANAVAITGGTITGLSSALPVASGGTGSTTSTGTGAVVLATSPTLSTPDLGTPSALVGTNITGTAASFTAGTATRASGINAAGASYLTGNAIGSYICTNFNVTPNSLGYTGTWTNYNQTVSPGQATLYGWIRTA
jgi:hypothetical protein